MTMSTALNAQPLVDPFYHMPDAEQQHSHLLHHGPQQHQHSQPHQHTMAPQSGSPTSYFGYAAAPPLTQARQPQQAQQTPLQSLQQSQQPQQQPSQIAPSNSLFSSMFDLSSALPGPNSHNNSPPQMTSKNLTSPNMLANGNSSSGMFDQHVSHQEAVVYIRNLPMDLTHREFRLMFLFAREFLNCELLKSQTETEGYAYFKSPMAAASAQAVLQNMPVFSSNQPLKCEVKYINRADSQQQPSSSASSRFASKSRFNFPSSVTSPLEMPPSIDYYTEPSNHFSPTSPRSSYSIESAAVAVANNVGKSMLLDEEDDSSIKDIVKDPVAWFSRTSSTSSTTSNQFEKTKRSSSSASAGSSTFANVANGTSSVPLSVSSAIGANVAASGLPPIGSNNNAKSAASAIRRPSGGSGMTSNIATSRQYAVVAGGPSSATSETSSASSTVVGSPPSNSPQQKSYSPPQKTLQAASGNTGSNGSVGSAGQNNSVGSVPAGNRIMPPANPADQNPPCNTLYVGNLPPDTSEEELKNVFSSRPGYKRLCFRTKANGPMCFVEFDDVSYATRALDELYGYALSNSVKGGIRLSFSKNPLGVRNNNKQQSSSSSQSQSNGGNSSVGYRYGNDYEYSRN